MKELARTDVLLALPKESGSDVYDVFSLQMNTDDYVIYKYLRKLYQTTTDVLDEDSISFVEKVVDEVPNGSIKSWNVVELGVGEENVFGGVTIDYALSRVAYKMKLTNFEAFIPLWTGVDIDKYLPSTGDILKISKEETIDDPKAFRDNLYKYKHKGEKISIADEDLDTDEFMALLIGGIVTGKYGEDVFLPDTRGTVVETDDSWILLTYHLIPSENMNTNGLMLEIPTKNPEQFVKIFTQIWKRKESLRIQAYQQLVIASNRSIDEATEKLEEKYGEQFDSLLVDEEV